MISLQSLSSKQQAANLHRRQVWQPLFLCTTSTPLTPFLSFFITFHSWANATHSRTWASLEETWKSTLSDAYTLNELHELAQQQGMSISPSYYCHYHSCINICLPLHLYMFVFCSLCIYRGAHGRDTRADQRGYPKLHRHYEEWKITSLWAPRCWVEAGTTESRGESTIISLGLHQQPWTRYNKKGKKKKRRREGIDMAWLKY